MEELLPNGPSQSQQHAQWHPDLLQQCIPVWQHGWSGMAAWLVKKLNGLSKVPWAAYVFGSDATRPASGPSSGRADASVLVGILSRSHSNIALVRIITT